MRRGVTVAATPVNTARSWAAGHTVQICCDVTVDRRKSDRYKVERSFGKVQII